MRASTWLLSGLALLGCGASACPTADHETFRAIQRHEARLDEVAGRALEGPCPDAREAAEEGCRAAADLCAIADSVADRDADLRCRAARERCARQRAAASTRCGRE